MTSFQGYSSSGQSGNRWQPLPILASRDPIDQFDYSDPSGGPYQIDQEWFNSTNKSFWKYAGQGDWVIVSGTGGAVVDFIVPQGTSPVFPDGSGNVTLTSTGGTIDITGGTNTINFDTNTSSVIKSLTPDASTPPGTSPTLPSAGTIALHGGATFATNTQANPIKTNSIVASQIDFQIQLAGSNATTAAANKFGVTQFDANQFTVTSGYTQLKGGAGPAIMTITGDDTTAVSPVSGNINLNGLVVANATHAKAVFTESSGAGTEKIDVQLSAAIASTDVAKVGLSAFSNKGFTVDANGFVINGAGASWTPVLDFGGSTVGITYATQIGNYIQFNDMVFFTFTIILTSKGAQVGTAHITGLPGTLVPQYGQSTSLIVKDITFTAGYVMGYMINSGGWSMALNNPTTAGANNSLDDTNFANTSQIVCNGVYLTV